MPREERHGEGVSTTELPPIGFGVRTSHYEDVLARELPVPFTEVIIENFLGRGGRPRAVLEKLAEQGEVALHGVSLSLGGTDPLPLERLRAIRELADGIGACIVSDHACFSGVGGRFGHDLWPMPFTDEAARNLADRISVAQDVLGRRILIENVSSYVAFRESTMTEWEFLCTVVERADAELLLDVNNVFVSAHNHGFDARAFLDAIPAERIGQVHLAGHKDMGTHLLDDHGSAVPDPVLELYARLVARVGPRRTLVEWDTAPPPVVDLVDECRRVASFLRDARPVLAGAA